MLHILYVEDMINSLTKRWHCRTPLHGVQGANTLNFIDSVLNTSAMLNVQETRNKELDITVGNAKKPGRANSSQANTI